jgi:hypothetical protein
VASTFRTRDGAQSRLGQAFGLGTGSGPSLSGPDDWPTLRIVCTQARSGYPPMVSGRAEPSSERSVGPFSRRATSSHSSAGGLLRRSRSGVGSAGIGSPGLGVSILVTFGHVVPFT